MTLTRDKFRNNQMMVAESLTAIGQMLGSRPSKPQTGELLSRHYTVFRIASSTIANFFYLVAGNRKDGFICTCVGFQSSGGCYHVRSVTETLSNDRTRRQPQKRAEARRGKPRGAKRRSGNRSRAGQRRKKR